MSRRDRSIEEAEERLAVIKRQLDEGHPIEITSKIERFELIEEKLGVRFEGIYGVLIKQGWEKPVTYHTTVNCDVVGTGGNLKNGGITIILSAYNHKGQLLGTGTRNIYTDTFVGIGSFQFYLTCYEAPVRFRLYPS